MKKTLLLMLICLSITIANAQYANQLNGKIVETFAHIDSIKDTNSDAKFESLFAANKQLAQNIIAFAEATPDFITQDLQDTALAVNSFYNDLSDDKKIRIVWWDDESGGTIRNYDYIIFWNTGGKLHHKMFVSNIEDSDASNIYYTYIDSVVHVKQSSGDDLYFIMGSSGDRFALNQHVFCYKIAPSGEFTTDAAVFKAGSKMLSKIAVDCPSYHDANGDVGFYRLLHFSKDNQTLYVPVFPDWQSQHEKDTENNDTAGNRKFSYFTYEFDGTNFVYKRKGAVK